MVKEILAAISQGKKFLITAHVRLDGDALGSELALYLMLKDLGKEAIIYNQDATPEHYRFLPAADHIVHDLEHLERYDVGFILDCSELDRVGRISADVAKIKTLINIDHHVSNGGFSPLRFLDPKASSTGELLYRLMRKMHVKMTKDRTVKGIDIAMLYTQMDENQYKLSLRSKGKVNVEKIARRFGGGGHINAAACRIDGDIETIQSQVLEAVKEL